MFSDSPKRFNYSVHRKGNVYVISRFLQMWTTSRRGKFPRVIAGVCAVLWVAGSVSTLYGGLTPQWTTPHCPQSHSNTMHHTHGSCAWHCDSIDTQPTSGRSWRPSIVPTGFLSGHLSAISDPPVLNGGVTSRGPPRSSLSAISSTI